MGQVKRRLAKDLGWTGATGFYRNTAAAIIRRLSRDRRWRTVLAITPGNEVANGFRWPGGVARTPQGPGDLGEKMARAINAQPPGPVVLVGTDIPDISADHIAQAFKTLGRDDAVFGPATDGGYWLVGLRRRPRTPDIFSNVRWSSEYALADTVARLQPGHSYTRLEVLTDIDAIDDHALWRRRPEIK